MRLKAGVEKSWGIAGSRDKVESSDKDWYSSSAAGIAFGKTWRA